MLHVFHSDSQPVSTQHLHMPARGNTARAGFTLVELLVVVGIIALLISMLLPALNKARDQANATSCLANMRQIGMALNQYTNEHRGNLPYCDYEGGWKPWGQQFYGNNAQAYQINNPHRLLMKYLGGQSSIATIGGVDYSTYTFNSSLSSSKVYRCPSSIDWPVTSNQPGKLANTNYMFNGVMVRRKITNIKRSSEIIAVSDGRYGWNASMLRPYPNQGSSISSSQNMDTLEYRQWLCYESGPLGGMTDRFLSFTIHDRSRSGSALYFDGHAANVGYRNVGPRDFGLGDGSTGLATDTYAVLSAGPTRNYRASLR